MLDIVSVLRVDAGTHPEDTELAALISELTERSNDFRRLWAPGSTSRKTMSLLTGLAAPRTEVRLLTTTGTQSSTDPPNNRSHRATVPRPERP